MANGPSMMAGAVIARGKDGELSAADVRQFMNALVCSKDHGVIFDWMMGQVCRIESLRRMRPEMPLGEALALMKVSPPDDDAGGT